MFEGFKKRIIKSSLEKKKAAAPFDINYADNYKLPSDAGNEMNDSHYFVLFNFDDGECLYYRYGARGGVYDNEVWLVYRDKGGNVYLAEKDHYKKGEALPVKVECIEAGKTLRYYYSGNAVKAVKTDKGYEADKNAAPVKIEVEGEFNGTSAVFEFMYHLSSDAVASALAKEKLSNLKEFRRIQQVHYEQAGTSTASVTLNGKKTVLKDFSAVRDHSYGVREWDYMDRYIWSIIILENGDFLHTSLIRYPVVKELQAGFYIKNNTEVSSILSATEMDTLPIIGNVPEKFAFKTVYVNGKTKNIESRLDFVVPFYFKGNFNVNEGIADFTVDGMRGKGISEFGFNADKNRWTRK